MPVFGGLLLMMGNPSRSESLFYYFRLEDQIPEIIYCVWSIATSTSILFALS
jgi:hypothetical protein